MIFLSQEVVCFFCQERLHDCFVKRGCVIFCPKRFREFCPERFRDFFCPERFCDFFAPRGWVIFLCPERLGRD